MQLHSSRRCCGVRIGAQGGQLNYPTPCACSARMRVGPCNRTTWTSRWNFTGMRRRTRDSSPSKARHPSGSDWRVTVLPRLSLQRRGDTLEQALAVLRDIVTPDRAQSPVSRSLTRASFTRSAKQHSRSTGERPLCRASLSALACIRNLGAALGVERADGALPPTSTRRSGGPDEPWRWGNRQCPRYGWARVALRRATVG